MTDCSNCFAPNQRAVICPQCLHKGLRQHHSLVERYENSIKTIKSRVATSATGQRRDSLRRQRAEHQRLEASTSSLSGAARDLKTQATQAAAALRKRREDYHARRAILQAASYQLSSQRASTLHVPATSHQQDPRLHIIQASPLLQVQYSELGKRLQQTRATLLEEAFTAYNVQAVDADELSGRDVGEAKDAQLHRIGGLILPAIGDIKRFLPDEISAAVSHTAHLVRLMALYLDVRLPFIINTGPKLSIRAAALTPWQQNWPHKYPLYISASITNVSTTSSLSHFNASKQTDRLLIPFVTAFAMLTFDIAWICAATGQELLSTNEPLRGLLQALAQAIDLQRHPSRASLNLSNTISLDFHHLLQTNLDALAASKADSADDDDEWALVDAQA